VVPAAQAYIPGHLTRTVQVMGECPPCRFGARDLAGREVDAEERVNDVLRLQDLGIGERGGPCRLVEGLRDEHMARAGPQPMGVEAALELRRGSADEAGVLDPAVADLVKCGQCALEVDS
jgi:hypothetical protein